MTSDADDKVSIVIAGESFEGWLDVSLDSDLFTQADAFKLSAPIPAKSVRAKILPFSTCDIYVGRDRQMAGFIDDVTPSGDRSSSRLSVVGRDLAAHLVDNESKKFNARDMNIKTMIEKLVDPSWGIKVVLSNEDNRRLLLGKKDKKKVSAATPEFLKPIPRASTKIDGGQKISQIIDTHCKRLGITWWMTAKGELFLGKPNYKQSAAYSFRLAPLGSSEAKNNNVERYSVQRSAADQYTEIVVNGVGIAKTKGLFDSGSSAPKFTATAVDSELQRRGIKRKLIISDSDITSKSEATKRAQTELQRRKLAGFSISLTVPGYRQEDRLYAVDTLASVKIEEADVDGVFYVSQRRFYEDRGKRRTDLKLIAKDVWLP